MTQDIDINDSIIQDNSDDIYNKAELEIVKEDDDFFPYIIKGNIEKAYHLLTAVSSSKFSTLLKENNPYKEFGEHTKEILFETEPLRISKDTYQVDYQVITRTLTGTKLAEIRQRAVITVKVLNPAEEDIKSNPLGIYITDFDIKDIN